MVYTTCISSPVRTEFLRDLGATEFHFGLLGGVPLIMLGAMFLGAWVTGRLRRRKPWFLIMVIAARLLYIPIALLPLLLPGADTDLMMAAFILMIGIGAALSNFTGPLWFSWMGDVIPRRILNRFWGERHRYMTLIWTISFLVIAAITFYGAGLSARTVFPILAFIGCAAGVIDVLLFVWVKEPENVLLAGRSNIEILLEPLRHREYRRFVLYSCAFSASAMLAAVFMQVYVLKVLRLALWQTNLAWCTVGLGAAAMARTWGHIADKEGQRPVLVFCAIFKPLICLVFLLVTPGTAFVVLASALFFDSMLNAGFSIASNGHMLKMAPKENRSMFIAAITGLSGISGGIGAIVGGTIMRHADGLAVPFAGRVWTNYHLIFLMSFLLRILCIPLAMGILEPAREQPTPVLNYLMGLWPMRVLMFPVGLYRRFTPGDGNGAEDADN